MHHKVLKLIEDFLAYKKSEGSVVEKNLYKTMSRQEFIGRLLSKRPLMFMNANDDYLLKNGTRGNGGFEKIGTNEEKSPLVLKDYLSYDEMQSAALIGVSVPTYFINNGNRQNKGIKAKEGEFEEQGILVGLVGARFEKPGFMEWQHVIITKQRDTDLREKNKLMDIWSRFYNKKFQTYAEVVADTSARYLKYGAQSYFDTEVYKERMKMVVEPFLLDAHRRGVKQKKKVYVHAVGLGLGVWKVLQEQTNLLLNVYEEVIRSIDNNLSQISDIDFNWFPADAHLGGVKNGEIFTAPHNVKIKVHFSKRDPAEKLQGENAGKLLMAQYAWDGNSYPGNEYWIGALTASGDPAAACCSTIAELQNPYINSYLLVALQNN
jgi:hypothetical protein